jgi:hypothetical protein
MLPGIGGLVRYKPRDYVGDNHLTVGSDILSVLDAVPLASQVLGSDLTVRLRAVKPDGWYPIELLLEAMDRMSDKLGRFALLQMGRKLFQSSHAEGFKKVAHSAGDLVFSMNAMYRNANRGTGIGGWDVVLFQPGRAELAKTTPHHCVMEEGILTEALLTLQIPALVEQKECVRKAAPYCRYQLVSPVTGELWMGTHHPLP